MNAGWIDGLDGGSPLALDDARTRHPAPATSGRPRARESRNTKVLSPLSRGSRRAVVRRDTTYQNAHRRTPGGSTTTRFNAANEITNENEAHTMNTRDVMLFASTTQESVEAKVQFSTAHPCASSSLGNFIFARLGGRSAQRSRVRASSPFSLVAPPSNHKCCPHCPLPGRRCEWLEMRKQPQRTPQNLRTSPGYLCPYCWGICCWPG